MQNQAPAKQELTLFVSGEANKFIEARKEQLVKNEPQKRLTEVLRLVMLKVGLREANLPAAEEEMVLKAHIISEYGNHTCEEIKLAFDLAIAGKLEIETKNISCYENFSCLYFSSIMNAYRLWAKEQSSQIKVKPKEVEEEEKVITEDDKKEWIEGVKNRENLNFQDIPILFYGYLNLKNEADNYEKAMIYCYHQIAEENTSFAYKKTRMTEFKRQRAQGYFEGEFRVLVKNTAQRMSVFDEFKKEV